jgi:hypothetical protein
MTYTTQLDELFPWSGMPANCPEWHVHNAFRCTDCDGTGEVCTGSSPMRAYLPASYEGTLLMGGDVAEYGACPACDGTGICADWREHTDYPDAIAIIESELGDCAPAPITPPQAA